jgi:hypothetical protein
MKIKHFGFVFIMLLKCFYTNTLAQIIYSQNFNAPTTLAGSGWTNTNLTTPWGNGSYFGISNIWQVNDNESGRPPGTCGAAGMGNQSLHIGATAFASGAAYLSNANTNRRISSPNINSTGYTNLQLSFNFIGNGYLSTDKAYLQYSTNGGTTWNNATGAPTSATPALPAGSDLNNLKSSLCSPQGRWTNITWNMPAACGNIPNLRIAFVWQNNSTTGTSAQDPSFAVDDITITNISPLPVELINFYAETYSDFNLLRWTTASEINFNCFVVEKSVNGQWFYVLDTVKSQLNSNQTNNYLFYDYETSTAEYSYYRLKQIDLDGTIKYSEIIAIKNDFPDDFEIINHNDGIQIINKQKKPVNIYIYNLLGQKLFSSEINNQNYFINLNRIHQIIVINICDAVNNNVLLNKKWFY